MDKIKALELFRGVDDARLVSLLQKCYLLRVEPDQILVETAQVNNRLYLILSGLLQARFGSSSDSSSINLLAGESVGEMSIIDDQPTSARVVALEPTEVLVIPGECFWDEVVSLPGVAKNLLRLLVKRMRQNNNLALQAHKEHLRYEYLQRDLTEARKIQQSMLPRHELELPYPERVDIYATVLPAKDVGGDFYDIHPLDDHRFIMVVGDVSGKGMPASLLMVKTLVLLRMKYNSDTDFAALMPELNRMLCEENQSCMYVTLFLALFDVESGEVRYANAGHNPPLILRAGQPGEFLETTLAAVPLGLFEQESYPVAQFKLSAGDSLLLYTDGVTEAENRQGEFFSESRLHAHVANHGTFPSARDMAKSLLDKVMDFAADAPQSDDITLLLMRFRF